MSAFRKRAEMLSLPHALPINPPVCERRWQDYDTPSCKRFITERFRERQQAIRRRAA